MSVQILTGDCRQTLATLPAGSAQTCVTSPPYFGLRDYGHEGQIGLEQTPDAYVAELMAVFRAVRRVLRDDGTLWLNLGDSYAGSKQLLMMPARVALALQADGWVLRQEIVWAKPAPMPENVTDRPSRAHEMVYLFARSRSYFYDYEAIKEPSAPSTVERAAAGYLSGGRKGNPDRNDSDHKPLVPFSRYADGRNARSVWTIAAQGITEGHFAPMPPRLAERCILAGSRKGDTVLDPFGGAGTTGLVADRLGRDAILCELNPEYAKLAEQRITGDCPLFAEVAS